MAVESTMGVIRKHARSARRRPVPAIEIRGVEFRQTPVGRRPYVTGAGMTVWELYHVWLDHKRNIYSALQSLPHLNASQIYAAVAYATEHPEDEPKGCWGVKPRGVKLKVVRV